MHAADVRVVPQVRNEKEAGGAHRGDHQGAVRCDVAAPDLGASRSHQHRAAAVQARVDDREYRVIRHLGYAAGFVVRRLAMAKATTNITSEKPARTIRQVGTLNTALAGNSSVRSASVP